jgi:predicted small metal-binding protein
MAEKKVSCDCGAVVRASNDASLIAQVRAHAKEVHKMEMTEEQILAMAEPA